MRHRHLSLGIDRDAANRDAGPERHSAWIPAHGASALHRSPHLLRLNTCLLDQIAMLVFVVNAIQLTEPFISWVIRLNGSQIVEKVLRAGLQSWEPLFHSGCELLPIR